MNSNDNTTSDDVMRIYTDDALQVMYTGFLNHRAYLYRRYENTPDWQRRYWVVQLNEVNERILVAQAEAKRRGYEFK